MSFERPSDSIKDVLGDVLDDINYAGYDIEETGPIISDSIKDTLGNVLEDVNYARVDTEESEPISISDFEKAKAFLSTTDEKLNVSAYDHLADVIKTILRSKVPDAVEKLEEISLDVKRTRQKTESDLTEVCEIPEELQAFVKEKQVFYQFKTSTPEADQAIVSLDEEEEGSDDDEEEKSDEEKETEMVEADSSDVVDEEPNLSEVLPDIYYIMSRFNEAGIGLSPMEIFELTVALKYLAIQFKLKKVKFWGKVLGIKDDYYIAEAPYQKGIVHENFGWEDPAKKKKSEEAVEMKISDNKDKDGEHEGLDKLEEQSEEEEGEENEKDDDEIEKDPEDKEKKLEEEDGKVGEESEEEGEKTEAEVPEPKQKEKKRIPAEKKGIGVNEYLYFVCTKLGEQWRVLPFMLPLQISEARYVKRFFTGDLESSMEGVLYPGKEAHYLRAQIARITATAHIAPVGFFKSAAEKVEDQENDDDDDEEGQKAYKIVPNKEFEPKPIKSLFLEDVEGWCHYRKAILYQGRCIPMKAGEKDEDEDEPKEEDEAGKDDEEDEVNDKDKEEDKTEEEEEEDPEILEAIAETQVPVLRSLSEDKGIGKVKPWSMKLSSKLVEEKAILVIYSNIWPGAYTFYDGKTFEHIYIGYGFKYSETPYTARIKVEPELEIGTEKEVSPKEEEENLEASGKGQDEEEDQDGKNKKKKK